MGGAAQIHIPCGHVMTLDGFDLFYLRKEEWEVASA